MTVIPKLSDPLKAGIRTSETILTVVVSAGIAAGSIIDPSKLPPKEAGILVGGLTALHGIQRTGLKAFALVNGYLGIEEPEEVVLPESARTPDGAIPADPPPAEAAPQS